MISDCGFSTYLKIIVIVPSFTSHFKGLSLLCQTDCLSFKRLTLLKSAIKSGDVKEDNEIIKAVGKSSKKRLTLSYSLKEKEMGKLHCKTFQAIKRTLCPNITLPEQRLESR
jgi:hypothetical protein